MVPSNPKAVPEKIEEEWNTRDGTKVSNEEERNTEKMEKDNCILVRTELFLETNHAE
jgi:hypothetical protein